MKIFRYLMMAVLTLGISSSAHAFQFTVLDPPSGPGFAIIEPGVPFDLTFVPCSIFNPSGPGCFAGFNDSDQTLTTLDITFPDTSALGSQGVSCTALGGVFGTPDCNLVGDVYILGFSGGTGIAPWAGFLVIESGSGVSPSDFPTGDAVANATPEPSSIWLALSGVGSLGYFVRRRRKATS